MIIQENTKSDISMCVEFGEEIYLDGRATIKFKLGEHQHISVELIYTGGDAFVSIRGNDRIEIHPINTKVVCVR